MLVPNSIQLFSLNTAIAVLLCTVVALALSACFRSLPKRYATLMLGMLACSIAPLVVLFGTAYSLGRLPTLPAFVIESSNIDSTSSAIDNATRDERMGGAFAPQIETTLASSSPDGFASLPANSHTLGNDLIVDSSAAKPTSVATSLVPLVGSIAVVIWLSGSLISLAIQMRRWWLCRRFLKACRPIDDSELRRLSLRVAKRLGVRGSITLLESDVLPTPVVIAAFVPRIVLPVDIQYDLSKTQLASVLAHEISHIQRKDHWASMLQTLVQILYWWNPMAHWISYRANELREMICDDIATTCDVARNDYARTIIQMAERTAATHELVGSLGISLSPISELERRLRRIIAARTGNVDLRISKRFIGVLCLSAIVLGTGLLFAQVPQSKNADSNQLSDKKTTDAPPELPVDAIEPAESSKSLEPSASGQSASPQASNESAKSDHNQSASDSSSSTAISGTVVDDNATPLAGAKISILSADLVIQQSTVADDQGRYRFDLDVSDSISPYVSLRAESPDGKLLGFARPSYKEPPLDNVEIQLQEQLEWRIRVVDHANNPIRDANVATQLAFPVTMGPFKTDANGFAMVRSPMNEPIISLIAWKDGLGLDYRLYALSQSPSPERSYSVPRTPDTLKETLKLDGSKPVHVRLNENGAPRGKLPIRVGYLSKQPSQTPFSLDYYTEFLGAETGADGRASFEWFPAWQKESTTLWINSRDYANTSLRYNPESQSPSIDVALVRTVPIRGRVSFADGTPAPKIQMLAVGVGYERNDFRAMPLTDADGRYEVQAAPNKIYMLSILSNQWAARSQSGFAVLPNQIPPDHDFVLSPATRVHGTVVQAGSKEPLKNQSVLLFQHGTRLEQMPEGTLTKPVGYKGELNRWPFDLRGMQTNARGQFETFVGDGDYELVLPDGQGKQVFAIDGETEKQFDLVVGAKKPIDIFGMAVSNIDGAPIAGGKIHGVSRDLQDGKSWDATTDTSGHFKFQRDPEPGLMRVTSSDGKLGTIVSLDDVPTGLQLRLQPTGSASGRLVSSTDKKPLTNIKLEYGVRVVDQNQAKSIFALGGTATSDADGRFTLEGLVPGWQYECIAHYTVNGHRQVTSLAKTSVEAAQAVDLGELDIAIDRARDVPVDQPKTQTR